jgi:hypothetical protein
MANTDISNAAAIAACNAIVDLLDAGAGAGKLRIYDNTSPGKPANPDVAITTQVLLVEFTLGDPAFGDGADSNPGGRATANAIADVAAGATGTAAWCRAVDSNGLAVIDGDVSATGGGGDCQLNSVSIVEAVNQSVTSWTITMPEG